MRACALLLVLASAAASCFWLVCPAARLAPHRATVPLLHATEGTSYGDFVRQVRAGKAALQRDTPGGMRAKAQILWIFKVLT